MPSPKTQEGHKNILNRLMAGSKRTMPDQMPPTSTMKRSKVDRVPFALNTEAAALLSGFAKQSPACIYAEDHEEPVPEKCRRKPCLQIDTEVCNKKVFAIKCSPACISADDIPSSVYTPTTAMLLDRCLMLDAELATEPALLPISPMVQALDTKRGAAWITA